MSRTHTRMSVWLVEPAFQCDGKCVPTAMGIRLNGLSGPRKSERMSEFIPPVDYRTGNSFLFGSHTI
jgi:hypothetical protein